MENTNKFDFSDRVYQLIVGIIVVLAVFLLGVLYQQYQALPQNAPHEVSFSGEGRAYAKPDVAIINLGVTSQATTSQEAVNQNNQKMNAIIKVVKDLGIEDKDIQTTSYNLTPTYSSDRPMGAGGSVSYPYPYPGVDTKISGYNLDQRLEVKIRDFDKINSVLDKAVANGANVVSGVQFTLDDPEKVKAEAREKAIVQAKEKASALMRQSGLGISKLVNVSEGYSPVPMPYYQGGYGGAAVKESMAPDVQAGQMEIYATVTLTYRVR